jgi:hypothetical protein
LVFVGFGVDMSLLCVVIAVIVWGLVGTIIIKQQLQMLVRRECTRSVVVVTAIVFSLLPIIVFRVQLFKYSALGIVVACVLIFWFAVLAIRSSRFT